MRAVLRQGREGLGVARLPNGANNAMAGFERGRGEGAPQARTDTGDEKSLGGYRRHATTPYCE